LLTHPSMGMYERLMDLERSGRRLRVVLVGASGRMGQAIALQIGKTPGMRLVAVAGRDLERTGRAADLHGHPWTEARTEPEVRAALRRGETIVTSDVSSLLERGREAVDVLVEATGTVGYAAQVTEHALRRRIDVVLLNAEVQSVLGLHLEHVAQRTGAILTSDAGDQHGVLLRMIDEMRLWGMEVVLAGNIKGFLDRYATPDSIAGEAAKRRLNPVMCAAFTDGTKVSIEMALVANATGMLPIVRGMVGPRVKHVAEVGTVFDLPSLRPAGAVDYVLGAEPGGGVFLVGYHEHPLQHEYLRYYKMGDGPFYVAYRPYHLCHLETPLAIATSVLERSPILAVQHPPVADVPAFAKADLAAGTEIAIGIGGPHVYGQVDHAAACVTAGAVPIALIESVSGRSPRLRRAVTRDELITWDDIELPESRHLDAWRAQQRLADAAPPWLREGAPRSHAVFV